MRIPLLLLLVLGLIFMTGCIRVREVPSNTATGSGGTATPQGSQTPEESAAPEEPTVSAAVAVSEFFAPSEEAALPEEPARRASAEMGSTAVPLIDYHIHIRGGMTVEKALDAQSATGVRSGVLENAGVDWPLSSDERIREFIAAAEPYPVYIGLQVNDRDWFDAIAPELLERLDFILADTMIMNDENGKPQKLWQENEYDVDDLDAWFDRYFAHCMRVVNEPVTILANPTWLPPRVAEHYDAFWNDDRMAQLIDAAVKNEVALEIQVGSAFPNDKFIALAKAKGAKFTIGRNNMDDKQPNFEPVFEKLQKHGLGADVMLVLPFKTER